MEEKNKDKLSHFNELDTIADWVRFAASEFGRSELFFGHGSENAWQEALYLVLPSLHLHFNDFNQVQFCKLTHNEKKLIQELINRRITERVPVAYLINKAYFCGLEFYVNESVLVPRSPFSQLILQKFEQQIQLPPAHVLDLCTGSGCIGIAIASVFEKACVDLSDISEAALEVAEYNLQAYGLENRVSMILSDVFESIIPMQQYDLIVSNPPYVDKEELDSMPEEYHHEPEIALGSGDDGLELTRKIIADAANYLTENGVLIIEVGHSYPQMRSVFHDLVMEEVQLSNGVVGIFVIKAKDLRDYQTKQLKD